MCSIFIIQLIIVIQQSIVIMIAASKKNYLDIKRSSFHKQLPT